MIDIVERQRAGRPADSVGKRMVDVLGAALVLMFFAPLGLIAVLGVRLGRDGPVFSREPVVGLDGVVFGRWRLHPAQGREGVLDRVMARAGLTYLPSVVNVIAGQMSLIGPAPHSPTRRAHLRRQHPDYDLRFQARPGMIAPGDGGAPSLRADLAYVSAWRGSMDLRLAGLFAMDGLFREPQEVD